ARCRHAASAHVNGGRRKLAGDEYFPVRIDGHTLADIFTGSSKAKTPLMHARGIVTSQESVEVARAVEGATAKVDAAVERTGQNNVARRVRRHIQRVIVTGAAALLAPLNDTVVAVFHQERVEGARAR